MPVSIKGTGGGGVTLDAGAAASATTLTLPNTTGTVALTASPTFSGTLTATTITSPAATALTIQSAGTTAMTVDTSQNVGVGTTSPAAKLNISQTSNTAVGIQIDNGSNGNVAGANIYLNNDAAGYSSIFQASSGASVFGGSNSLNIVNSRTAPITFWANAAERMRIGSSGQIGIGGANYGTSGQVLTSGGSGAAPSWANPSSGITLATSVATTSGTAFDFTGIPSTVKRITVIFNGVQASTSSGSGGSFLVQLGTSSGIENTGYVSTGNCLDSAGGSSAASSTAGFLVFNNASTANLGGSMTINLFSGNIWVENHTAQTGDNARSVLGGGTKTTAATLDRIRLTTTNSASFTAGSVTIQYE